MSGVEAEQFERDYSFTFLGHYSFFSPFFVIMRYSFFNSRRNYMYAQNTVATRMGA